MNDLTIYDSSQNVAQSATKVNQSVKQVGEFNWKIPANKSGKIRIAFNPPYQMRPTLTLNVSVTGDSPCEVHNRIANFDNTGFTLHLINIDPMNETSGNVTWTSVTK